MADQQARTVTADDAYNDFFTHVKDPSPQYEPVRGLARQIMKQYPGGLSSMGGKAGFVRELQKLQPHIFEGTNVTGLDSGQPSQQVPIGPEGEVDIPKQVPGNNQQQPQLAYRNNNPGNLTYAGQNGAKRGDKGFAQFENPEKGYAELKHQISIDTQNGLTLSQYITKFAPPKENPTAQYIAQAAKQLGVDPNAPLDRIDPEQLAQIQVHIESHAQVKPPTSPDQPRQAKTQAPPRMRDLTPEEFAANPIGGALYSQMRRDPNKPYLEDARPGAEKIGQLGKGHGKVAEFSSGFAQGVAETGIDMTTLSNAGLAAASILGPGELKAGWKILKYAPSLVRGVFTGQMLNDLRNELGSGFESLYIKGDYKEAGKYAARLWPMLTLSELPISPYRRERAF